MTPSRQRFFDHLTKTKVLGPVLTQSEIDGCSAVLDAVMSLPLSWRAYALATAYHETAHTMMPVIEAYWLSPDAANRYFTRMYDITGSRPALAKANGNIKPGDGPTYCGRGYVELTWYNGYKRATERLRQHGIDVDLLADPHAALRPDIAAAILRFGMCEGWFSGRKFSDYLPDAGRAATIEFIAARRIINGVDDAELIAGYAAHFQDALQAAGVQ